MLNSAVWAVTALAMAALGLTLLYASWRGRWRRGRDLVSVLGGWLLLAVAMPCWVEAAGVEFGVSLSLLAPPCIVLLLLVREWLRSGGAQAGGPKEQRNGPQTQRAAVPRPAGQARSTTEGDESALLRWLRHLGRFMLVVPISALSAVLIAVALSRILPFGVVNGAVAAVLVVPVLWGVIAWWMLADPLQLRPVAGTVIIALASATALFK